MVMKTCGSQKHKAGNDNVGRHFQVTYRPTSYCSSQQHNIPQFGKYKIQCRLITSFSCKHEQFNDAKTSNKKSTSRTTFVQLNVHSQHRVQYLLHATRHGNDKT